MDSFWMPKWPSEASCTISWASVSSSASLSTDSSCILGAALLWLSPDCDCIGIFECLNHKRSAENGNRASDLSNHERRGTCHHTCNFLSQSPCKQSCQADWSRRLRWDLLQRAVSARVHQNLLQWALNARVHWILSQWALNAKVQWILSQ